MKINRYAWEEEGAPVLPYLDSILQKFDNSIVAINEDAKVIGYCGWTEDEDHHRINSFWTLKDNAVIQRALLQELKKEVSPEKQKRIGMTIDTENEKFIKILNECDWYVHLENSTLEIYAPSRACFQVMIPLSEIERIRTINEHNMKE